MKFETLMIRMAVVCCAAVAAVGCHREKPDPFHKLVKGTAVYRTVQFQATQNSTKSQFGTPEDGVYPTLWTTNDSEVKLSLNYGSAISVGLVPAKDFRTASVVATIDFSRASSPYTFYTVSPASAAVALSPSREAWKVSIPCEQTPTAGSVDEAGIILAAASTAYAEVSSIGVVDLKFNHLTAYGRMSLNKLALTQGETVSAVELTSTTPIVGDWYWKTSGSSITDYGASSTLTINTTGTSNIWFACAPVDVSKQTLTVTVYTSKGQFTQQTEFPANCTFEAGRTSVFTIDMTGAKFIENGSGISTSDPMFKENEYGCYLGSGLEWTLDASANQVTRYYNDDGVLTYTLINPAGVEELEISGYTKSKHKGDTFDVRVKWHRGAATVVNADFNMTLIKEQGPKVWLSDGRGNGLIIKK